MIKTTDSVNKPSKLNNAALGLSKKRPSNKRQVMSSNPNTRTNDSDMDSISLEISDILTKRYGGISVYAAVMILLAIAIIWTAVLTAMQVQQYHQDYMTLQKMKSEHRRLEVENQRLIIEQQTFSATPQIASRAVTQLGMYSPSTKDKLILQPTAITPMNLEAKPNRPANSMPMSNRSVEGLPVNDSSVNSLPVNHVSQDNPLLQGDGNE